MTDNVTPSSGNVFEDLGLPNPSEAEAKARLAYLISMIIKHRGLTQVEAANRLGIDQPKISNLARGKLSGFTIDRLLKYALALGNDVEIIVKEHKNNDDTQGQLRVAV